MSATTRRSTRRTAATAATESSQPASRQSSQSASPAPEAAPKKKPGRKPKAAAAKVESQTVTESQQTVTKGRATSRANAASAVTTTTTTSSTTKTATQAPVVAKKLTRAGRQALKEAGVEASPQRSLEQTKPVKQGRGTARQKVTSEKRKAVAAKLAAAKAIESAEDEAEAENEDGMGAFFTKSKHQLPHSYTPSEEEIDNELRKEKYEHQEREIDHLRERVTNQEARIQNLVEMMWQKDQQMFLYENENLRLRMEITRLENIPHISYGTPANVSYAEFDSELVAISESSPAHGVFVNGNEEALALLHKIESSAKETRRVEPLSNDSETFSDNDVAMEPSPQQPSAKRTFEDVTATPNRPVATPSNIFSRSFSAIKSRLFSSTPKPPPTPEVASPTVTKPLPPQNTITETLSLPPTPVGERVKTPNKRRAPMNTLLKLLLKGVDRKDRHKAEEWAKQVIPELKNDTAFSEKRARLQKDVLCKELSNFPSAKPWETGFGDPLGDLDDDDVVPVWAVYLDIVAEEEEHTAKKHKKTHEFTTGDDEVPTIDEQFAASNGARTSPKLYNSHGQSASLRDFHPRRSIDPSPMFSNSISHNTGGNIFSELQGHDTAAQIRENDREVLKSATKENTHSHNPGMGSFSVPDDDSDEEDSTMGSESADAEATPIWTQPPPPAPVPAHAPLPGGSTDEASDVPEAPPTPTRQQPGDEIERQRQRLMKHTPAKPSRLREATYPSPSILSEAGNVSLLAATPAQMATSASSMFDDMPGAEIIELDDECQAEFEDIINSHEYQQKFNVEWQAPTLTYESDEEEPSPTSSS